MKIIILILLLVIVIAFTKPFFSKIIRGIAIIILSLMILNPKITTYESRDKKIAIVFDLTKSSRPLIDFYKTINANNFDKFGLGDSIYEFKGFDFKYNITNLNALKYLKNYDKIVYIGDGWHNYPSEIDYNSFNAPIYVLYPSLKIEEAVKIKSIFYPKNVLPGELFQVYVEFFSNKDTTIDFQISLDTTIISRSLTIRKGVNSNTFVLKAPSEEGIYKITMKISNKQRAYAINVKNYSKIALINAYKITPEIGLLNRLLREMGYEVIVNLRNEKINKSFVLTIGYGKDGGEDIVFLDGKKQLASFKVNDELEAIDSVVAFDLDDYIIKPISGIYNDRVFVLTDKLWKIGRVDFNAYKDIMTPILNSAIELKPKINIDYRVILNKAYIKISSNNPNIKFFANNKEISNYNVFEVKKPETITISGLLNNKRVYENKIILKPDTIGFETEEGTDSITLANLVNRTGGKFIKSLNEIKSERIKVKKEVFNNLFFAILIVALFLLDFTLRRVFGYR